MAIALGSNLGNRHAHLAWAVDELRASLRDARTSTFIETDPVGVPDNQPPYLNGAVAGLWPASAHDLLRLLLRLEAERGRQRTSPRAARTLDLDLILFGDQIVDDADLVVPHPRFRERAFVLEPLAEIAADWIDPVSRLRVDELWNALGAKEKGA